MNRPPLPPFSKESAIHKVRAAKDGWNNRYPARVALAFAPYIRWHNRVEFRRGCAESEALLIRK